MAKAKPKRAKKPTGQCSRYTRALARDICLQIAKGASLRAVCAQDGFPPHNTVLEWVQRDQCGFADQYARACETRTRLWAEDIMEIADSGHDLDRDKERISARKWMLSKMLPKQYGDKVGVEHSGAVGLSITINRHKE